MQAVVRRGTSLICDEIADPVPLPGQVLARTLCCGICGSDLHALPHFAHMMELGRKAGGAAITDAAQDVVFGHEFCAEILDHGPGTERRLKVGTRVVGVPVAMGTAGMETVGYSNRFPGGFAERMALQEALLIEVPNGLSDRQAALTEPFAVGEHAVAEAQIGPDAVALVVGCGPVGLAVIAALKARGLGPVLAADFSPARRRMAEVMGADEIIDPAQGSPHTRWGAHGVHATLADSGVARLTGAAGKRAVIFECVGAPGVLQGLLEGAPPGARIVVAGVCMQADSIEPFLAITKQLSMTFVLGYTPDEFALTLHRIAEGQIDVAPVITDAVGLSGVADAFVRLGDPETQVKIMVEPARSS